MKKISLIIVLIIISSGLLQSQSGVKFQEFIKRLEPYFAKELIEDIEKEMPKGNFMVWGYDAGDFSGDGNNDLAFVIKPADKKKIMIVYLFVDIDGYLTKVAKIPVKYFSMPLETGVNIKQNACYVTQKLKQNNWAIRGYRFDNGALFKVEDFKTEKIQSQTHETMKNYSGLQALERYFETKSGRDKFRVKYMTLPCYPEDKQIVKGYYNQVQSNDVDYVPAGAYYWNGDKDCNLKIKSSYSHDFLYFTLYVKDDNILTPDCEGCSSDFVELWFDMNQPGYNADRFSKKKGNKIVFREPSTKGVYCFSFNLGNFLERKPYLNDFRTTDKVPQSQRDALKSAKVSTNLIDSGYVVSIKLPVAALGIENLNVEENIIEYGFSPVVHDIDNQYRPEEEKIISISTFDARNPKSFGSLLLIPNSKWYGESSNIFNENLKKMLNEYGF